MTKKKYYELLGEYEQLVIQKEFNPNFCDNERFYKVRKKLVCILRRELLENEFECGVYIPLYKEQKMDALLRKIIMREPITKEDYEGTSPYVDVHLLFDLIALFILFGILAIVGVNM